MNQPPIIIMKSESVESMNQLLEVYSGNDSEFMREISAFIVQELLLHFIIWIVIETMSLDQNNFINILQENQIKIEIIIKVILILLFIYQQTQTKDTNCKTQMRADCNNNYYVLFYPLLLNIIAFSHKHYNYKFTNSIPKQQQKQSYIYTIMVYSISPAKKNRKTKKKRKH